MKLLLLKYNYLLHINSKLIFILTLFLGFFSSYSQCAFFGTNTACTTAAPTVIGNSISCTPPNNDGGRRNFEVTNMIGGATYSISNCGSGYDTQMTIYNSTGTTVVGFNDDNGPLCTGSASSINFIPPTTGTYRIQLNRYNCSTIDQLNGTITVTYTAPSENTVPTTGNNTYTLCVGNLYDSGGSAGNYLNNSDGYTVITPSIAGNFSRVSGTINSEAGYDYLTIYDGIGTTGAVLWGGSAHGSGTACTTFTVPTITSMTGSLTIRFRSDGSTACSGFNLTISCSTTPGTITYCTPTTTSSASALYINKVAFIGTLNDPTPNTSTYATVAPLGYQNFTGLANKAIQSQGEGVNISASSTGSVLVRGTWKAWVDWNKNSVFEPATEEVYNVQGFVGAEATFGFVIPSATAPGDYRIRIRINNGIGPPGGSETYGYNFTPCDEFSSSGSTNNYGEAEDYLFTVVASCSANIATVTDGSSCGAGPVTLSVTGTVGTTSYKWYTTETGGTAISGATTNTYTTPLLSVNTIYYVTALNGTCESLTRRRVLAKINPTPVVSFTPAAPIVCGDATAISLVAGGDKEIVTLIDEKFEGGGLGVFSNINNDTNSATVKGITSWKNQTSTLVPNSNVWFPAIASNVGTNKFALAYSDAKSPNIPTTTVENSITLTNSVNTTNFINLTLKLKLYYSRYYSDGYIAGNDEYVNIELSTNGGTTYPIILQSLTSDTGIGTRFTELTYNLNAYVGIANLKIRIRHRSWAGSGWLPDGVAVDDIELFGEKPLNTSFNYNTSLVDAFTNLACTIPYTTGTPATIIYIKPNVTQLENASFSIPVTTTLSNGCAASGSVTITNNSKLYTPSAANSDWNTASNWKPAGVPTASNCIVVYKDVVITGPGNTESGLNLTIKPGKTLNINSDNSLIITDFINVENTGVLQVENNSNLVQINNVTNTGNIIYKRTAPSIKGSDYVYWASPVLNQVLNSIYTSPAQGPKYEWNTTIANGNGGFGNWVSPDPIMAVGKGYIIRGSSNFGMAATNLNSTFTGIPNNGTISTTVYRGTYTGGGYTGTNGIAITNLDDNNNLLGNPYPSAINALQFISDNSAVIEGNVKLWTHGTNPGLNNGTTITNPFYGTYLYNYSASDYVTINYTGTTIPTATQIIKAGQAFFVEMKDGATGSGTVNFNNSQRRNGSGLPYANNNFFRNSNQQNSSLDDLERHRIWLDIKNTNNTTETTLIGYIEGATMNSDSTYDALANPLDLGIYSFINSESFVIQGRSLPFNDNDQVSIGFNVPSTGTYSIGINTADGLFLGTQDVYLKDELLNIYHDLKSTPYSFTTTNGTHNNRFKLVYKNTVLSKEIFNINENEIQIAKNKNIIEIVSGNEIMENVKIYDVRGRLLVKKTKINNNTISIDVNGIQDQVLILNITTSEGVKVTKKIL